MKKAIVILAALLAMSVSLADAATRIGVVVAVDKKTFTIKPEVGDKTTFTCDPDMGKKANRFVSENEPLGATPDKIEVGMIVRVTYTNEKGDLVSKRAMIIEEHLGTREIDFSPMLIKGKDTLPKFSLQFQLQSRPRLGSTRSLRIVIDFKEGASAKEVRDCVKVTLSGSGRCNHKLVERTVTQGLNQWKVKEDGEAKLLIDAYHVDEKDEPVKGVEIEAKDLPKERQPKVRLVNPRDPTK